MNTLTDDPVKQPPRPKLLQVMGPGLITGASDDDPSGIATYSQVGAQFGYGLAWTLLFSYPLMAAIQEISARIGRVTGSGIAGNLREHYPRWLSTSIVGLLLLANIINLGADLGAMGAALKLLISGPALLYVCGFGLLSVVLEVFIRYARYVSVLKWLCLSLFSYVICAFVVKVPWGPVGWAVVWPALSIKPDYLVAIVAVMGTTISPYLFFWQSDEEVEDMHVHPRRLDLFDAPEQGPKALHRIEVDTLAGMGLSNLVALAILATTAATLHAGGIVDIETSAQAAQALRPIAGPFAALFFTVGLIGTGLLAVPVLAGSAAYAIGEARSWPVGFTRKMQEAKAFYATIAVATLIGMVINFTSINPIKALYWSAVLNGVVAVPVMFVMMKIVSRTDIMGKFAAKGWLRALGWMATAVMLVISVGMVVTSI